MNLGNINKGDAKVENTAAELAAHNTAPEGQEDQANAADDAASAKDAKPKAKPKAKTKAEKAAEKAEKAAATKAANAAEKAEKDKEALKNPGRAAKRASYDDAPVQEGDQEYVCVLEVREDKWNGKVGAIYKGYGLKDEARITHLLGRGAIREK